MQTNRQHASPSRLGPRNGAVRAHAAISVTAETPYSISQNFFRNSPPYSNFGTYIFWSALTIFSVYLGGLLYPLHSSLLAIFSRLFLSAIFSRLFSVSHLASHCLSALLRRPHRQFRRRHRIYLADAIHPRRGTRRWPKAGSATTYPKRGTRRGRFPFQFLCLCTYYFIYFAYTNRNQFSRPFSVGHFRLAALWRGCCPPVSLDRSLPDVLRRLFSLGHSLSADFSRPISVGHFRLATLWRVCLRPLFLQFCCFPTFIAFFFLFPVWRFYKFSRFSLILLLSYAFLFRLL